MKNFNEFINEKLTLNDISKMSNRWVDANKLSFDNMKEGCIVETAENEAHPNDKIDNNNRYIYVSAELAEPLLGIEPDTKTGYVFLQKNKEIGDFAYLSADEYVDAFPKFQKSYSYTDYTIKKVYIRKKQYKNSNELEKDLKNIDKF